MSEACVGSPGTVVNHPVGVKSNPGPLPGQHKPSVCVFVRHGFPVEVSRQLVEVTLLLPLCGAQELNSGSQT